MLIVIVFGLLGNFYLAVKAFEANSASAGLMFCALGVGSGVLYYRTYLYWDEMPR
jgi:hypothetical protein